MASPPRPLVARLVAHFSNSAVLETSGFPYVLPLHDAALSPLTKARNVSGLASLIVASVSRPRTSTKASYASQTYRIHTIQSVHDIGMRMFTQRICHAPTSARPCLGHAGAPPSHTHPLSVRASRRGTYGGCF